MKLKQFLTGMLLFLAPTCAIQAQTQIIAHRGFWKTQGSAQNSIASFTKADSIGCYGSEFDVWLASDGELVVNHDKAYNDLNMEKNSSETLTKLRLANGETLPSLKEYLGTASRTQTKFILELKTHTTREAETQAVRKIIEMVDKMGLNTRMEYIAFSLHAVKEFIRLAPKGTPVFYLNGDLAPAELKKLGCAGADYQLKVYQKHPEWIKECRELGMKTNVWTVDDPKDMQWAIDQKIDYITTDEPLVLKKLLK